MIIICILQKQCSYCIRFWTRGGVYSKIWPKPEGNLEGLRPYFTVYPNLSPNTYNIPFPNKDSTVAVAAVQGFSFGLDLILFVSWKIFLTLYVILKEFKLNRSFLGM